MPLNEVKDVKIMKKPLKIFRKLDIEPQNIKFRKIKFIKVIKQLPAGNDVLECLVIYKKRYQKVIIKLEKSLMADFESEIMTIEFLKGKYNKLPKIIEYGKYNNKFYIVYKKESGNKLSQIFKKNQKQREKLLTKLGEELAIIHLFNGCCRISKKRVINYIPTDDIYKPSKDVKKYINWLKENQISYNNDTFIHGDFHYGNVLFEDNKINKVIDYEYSGLGLKEQDIAWALVLRPNQKFLDNMRDINYFLNGYLSYGKYDLKKLIWCYINACIHFHLMNNDIEYKNKLIFLMSNVKKQGGFDFE